MTPLRTKLEQNLGWGILALLLTGCLLVLWPFVTALLWGVVLSFSSWPIYRRLLKWLGGRRTLAALLVSLAMILVVLLPFGIVGLTLADNVAQLKTATQRWLDAGPPAPPAWLDKVPLVGQDATETWRNLAADSTKLLQEAKRFVEPVGSWLLKAGLKLGAGLFDLALSILVTFFLLRNGPMVAANLTAGIERIAGDRGKHLLGVAGNTVRGVVYGILGTALAQALMAGIGFLVAGVPGAALLAMLTFFLSVVPVGPPLVWLPAAFWLFSQGRTGWGIFMLMWGVGVSTVDNFVKPWLISQGSDLPFVLILFGVLGGALAFGFIGVFIGPTLLAVGYRLVKEWAADSRSAPGGAAGRSAVLLQIGLLVLMPNLAGCKTHSVSKYVSPRVVGRVVDSHTQLPLQDVQVRKITAAEESRRVDSEKGAQRMKQPLVNLTDKDGRFVLESVRELAVFRQLGWYSVSLSFEHAHYERLIAPYTVANATNTAAGEPVVNTGDVLLVPQAK